MTSPILIVGAGVAGLYTALKLSPRPVTLLTARPLGTEASSAWAQGGMAAAIGENDSPNLHFADTMEAGAGLVDPDAARVLVEGGLEAVEDLALLGVEFDRDASGDYILGREAAHCRDRIVHATGDQAGAEIMRALIAAARTSPHIEILERVVVEDLLTDDEGAVAGVLAYVVERGERVLMEASETVLATEALRGAGAVLVNAGGKPFMQRYHRDRDLAPRDVVARAVEAERKAKRGAFLDARGIGGDFPEKFPTVFAACARHRFDPREALLPVAPAAHYHMGGVMTDLEGRSSLDGLSAVGEVASTGVHGANRLASNSLLEAVVFGAAIARRLKSAPLVIRKDAGAPEDRFDLAPKPADPAMLMRLRKAMSDGAAVVRTEASLNAALAVINDLNQTPLMTSGLKSALASAELIVQGALMREESRGGHYRADFPQADEEPMHTEICLAETAELEWEEELS